MRLLLSSALFLSAAAPYARAANDWTKPCLQGDCSYDVAGSDASIAASMRIVRIDSLTYPPPADARARSGARPTRSPTSPKPRAGSSSAAMPTQRHRISGSSARKKTTPRGARICIRPAQLALSCGYPTAYAPHPSHVVPSFLLTLIFA